MEQLIKTLPAILEAAGAAEEVVEAACVGAWKHVVGEGLSGHAVPVQLQSTTLVVVVEDATWQKQLEQMRGQFLFRLNSILGQSLVKSIEFRIDPKRLAQLRGPAARKRMEPPHQQIPAELLAAAAAIEDVELRRAFLGAATSRAVRLEESESKIRQSEI